MEKMRRALTTIVLALSLKFAGCATVPECEHPRMKTYSGTITAHVNGDGIKHLRDIDNDGDVDAIIEHGNPNYLFLTERFWDRHTPGYTRHMPHALRTRATQAYNAGINLNYAWATANNGHCEQ